MGAFKEAKENNTKYLVLKDYSICEESKVPRDGFLPVDFTNPRTKETVTKYLKKYSSVEGYATKLEWYDTEQKYEQRYLGLKLHLDVDGTPAVLDLPWKTRPYDTFTKIAENVDWEREVEIGAFKDRHSDPPVTVLVIKQDGVAVKWKYTKDHPGECPPAVQEVDGWDFREQRRWLAKRMLDVVAPIIESAAAHRLHGAQEVPPGELPPVIEDADEDIPF